MRNMAAKRSLEAGALREVEPEPENRVRAQQRSAGDLRGVRPNGLDGKDSEFANDAARQSNGRSFRQLPERMACRRSTS